MTLDALMKHLAKLREKHGGRVRVGVAKDELWDGNETFNICDISTVRDDFVPLVDGDGFSQYTQKGYERGSIRIIFGNEKGS